MPTPDLAELAVWRYGIISILLHRNEEETLEEALISLADRQYRKPDGRFVSYSPETLRKWFYRYRNGGLPALNDTPRKDTGTHGSVPKTISDRLFELRSKHPRWPLSRMLGELIRENLWNMKSPARSTLYRFSQTANLHRDPHLSVHIPARPFEYEFFGQLWMADFLHGPKIREKGNKRKTYRTEVPLIGATDKELRADGNIYAGAIPGCFTNRAHGSVGPSIGSLAPCLQPHPLLDFSRDSHYKGWRQNKPDYKESTREEFIYKSVFRKHQI
jgi:hypothetical protein